MMHDPEDEALRWGEPIALKPRHLNLTTGKLTVKRHGFDAAPV